MGVAFSSSRATNARTLARSDSVQGGDCATEQDSSVPPRPGIAAASALEIVCLSLDAVV
jgi:hypothetical protein